MAQTKLQPFTVYLPDDLARVTRSAAVVHGGNVSAYFRALVEREANRETTRPAAERRMLEYLLTINIKQLELHGADHAKAAQTIHSQRMAQGKSYAD